MTKQEAIQRANELCSLLGSGWTPDVWHNLYWCYAARNGGVRVFEQSNPHIYWMAFWMPRSTVVGESGVSPGNAVIDLQDKYKRTLEEVQNHYNNLASVKFNT